MSEEKAGGCILVIGGGISGLTAAIEAAEAGYNVYLVEKNPYLGGRVAQLWRYFPKLCPPYCGLEILFKRLKNLPRLKYFTNAEVESISGEPGNFDVTVKINPRYVTDACTACGECVKACPAERPNEFNYGMDKTKAIYLPHEMSFPMKYVIDAEYCQKNEGCKACVDACPYDAIDLAMEPKTLNLKAGAIVVATGWKPYDKSKLDNLLPDHPNVITNVMFERLAALGGPTKGKIVRPSDGKPIESIAFVQCAGSRDENHLPYCSAVCCLASLKQATYIREQYPDAKVYIFYIDIRAFGRFEDFFAKVKADENIELIKGKVANIVEAEDGDLIVEAEDTETGVKRKEKVNMVVLATGMQPSDVALEKDEYGFAKVKEGIFVAGCARKPADVASCVEDATGAALKAIQILRR
ncbi:CoB--CoM heterodisulfide reductase iron-sulfur subunit A family protein [Archaeoglobus veneficus]|uniref:CoB--CoM heterodisulfide reductase iron-sulfur subunit A n=1 Tax=Archaeoglobus veneficus (strain DSM 11195 / SNP6) TaxID=693661 RepID=F2KPU9_ARCVS|nr:CoB--CoM heterodisulfide reductase iron-sulfur subunit A family protein [Archaeoglobus veneficus]AEA46456.1 fumarate reductase/succinate dehydrogenase flavoprotein domain protein [Archaeoglobus veneficus SNP6]